MGCSSGAIIFLYRWSSSGYVCTQLARNCLLHCRPERALFKLLSIYPLPSQIQSQIPGRYASSHAVTSAIQKTFHPTRNGTTKTTTRLDLAQRPTTREPKPLAKTMATQGHLHKQRARHLRRGDREEQQGIQRKDINTQNRMGAMERRA